MEGRMKTLEPHRLRTPHLVISLLVALCTSPLVTAQRARELGVPFHGTPGRYNAITDIPGVEVGESTVLASSARPGARSGVTAIFPLGRHASAGVMAGEFTYNGTGEMTGSHLIRDFGAFFGPVMLTGTTAVGTVSEAVLRWTMATFSDPLQRYSRILPVVAETYDGDLNDAWAFPLNAQDVISAIDTARGGPVPEGNVGGGTGMIAHDFKGGTGTSSRLVTMGSSAFVVGVLVQANYGRRDMLTVAGVPVGEEISDLMPARTPETQRKEGSIIIVVATNAPLTPTQLTRMAKRATAGLARVGGIGGATSGDLFLAFSTANRVSIGSVEIQHFDTVPADAMSPLFLGVADATEEAIVNALVAAKTLTGFDGLTVFALPHDRLRASLKAHGRLLPPARSGTVTEPEH
jgi:D-aminopeptidase